MNRWLALPPADRPLVIGHRGASAEAPDNSPAALRLAVEQGADGVEVDVRFSADERVVLYHDAEAPGLGALIDHSLAEIREAVPHIAVLDDLVSLPRNLLLDVEIKNGPGEPDFDPEHRMVAAVTQWVEHQNVGDRVLISSFNRETLRRVRAIAPHLPTGLLLRHGIGIRRHMERAAAEGHRWLLPRSAALRLRPKSLRAAARAAGLFLGTWTVDAAWELWWLRRAGIDAVITNRPGRAVSFYR